jgi:protein-disulfide isomerase
MVDHISVVCLALACVVACGGIGETPPQVVHVDDVPTIENASPKATTAPESLTQEVAPWSDADSPVPITSADAMWGSRTAKVTIVTFMDLECPYSAKFLNGQLKDVRDAYGPDKVRVVFKHMPLPFHSHAMPMAVAGRAVFARSGGAGFFEFATASFGNRDVVITHTDAFEVPAALGLAQLPPTSSADRDRYQAEVDADVAIAKKIGVTGTPATFINGVSVSGAQPLERVTEVIDRELEAVNLLAGIPPERVYVERSKTNYRAPASSVGGLVEDGTTVWKVPLGKAPIRGNKAGALVTIVEFTEFECPYCAIVQPTLEKIRVQYKDDVRIAFRHHPLPFHKRARPASTLALEAFAQKGDKGFWAAHDALFDRTTPFDQIDFSVLAKRLGLSVSRFEKALTDERWDDFLDDESDDAERFGATGTPNFFINGRRLRGAQSFETFTKVIDEELVRAKALRDRGVQVNRIYDRLIAGGKEPPVVTLEKKSVGPIPKTAPVKGPPSAKVTIQIFSDFQCPFCSRAVPTIAKIEKRYRNRVRFVWRDLPLAFHKDARPAAMAAREAHRQQGNAGFWPMHDLLFANQALLDRPALESYASTQKLDLVRFGASLDASSHDALIQADIDAATAADIKGTPSFLVNGYFLQGAQPFPAFRRVIGQALKEK